MSAPAWHAAVRQALQASRATFDTSLRKATTLRIGGPAECLVELEEDEDLERLFAVISEERVPYHVLGRGSNVLVPDEGLAGVVLRLGKAYQGFRRLEPRAPAEEAADTADADTVEASTLDADTEEVHTAEANTEKAITEKKNTVEAGAALVNPMFVERCRAEGLGGMEFLIAVPGSIGGAVAMNAGAHGGDTAQYLESLDYFEQGSGLHHASAKAFRFSYRKSELRGQERRLVLRAVFHLEPMSDEAIVARKTECLSYRARTQPRDYPNCGSVFKNPPGDYAARLIEEAGLKGERLGDAQVSEKHANFMVNRGQATAAEVLALIARVQETVYKKKGVNLELELQVLGTHSAA